MDFKYATSTKSYLLPLIVVAQLFGTSLWFVPNAVLPELEATLRLEHSALSWLTSAVQIGFIFGTLTFALLSIADRFSPSKVFFLCSLLGALTNGLVAVFDESLSSVVVLRALTGFWIAGIYPVGMKIASDHFGPKLGKALGWLLGALVLGTGLPHLMKAISATLPWQSVVLTTSALAVIGGLVVMLFVFDGPYRKKATAFNPKFIATIYSSMSVRQAAFGYFGHMWELYAFWAFVPILIAWFNSTYNYNMNISLFSFSVFAAGAIGCVVGGFISQRIGSNYVAYVALACSGLCCLISPWWMTFGLIPFVVLILFWGLTVVPDSPQFSTTIARTSIPELTGTTLTSTNSIGFLITIVSIQVANALVETFDVRYLGWLLLIGPMFGFGNCLLRKRTV